MTRKGHTKVMISFVPEVVEMLDEIREAAPYYGKVGALSIIVEDAVRKYYKAWKARNPNAK